MDAEAIIGTQTPIVFKKTKTRSLDRRTDLPFDYGQAQPLPVRNYRALRRKKWSVYGIREELFTNVKSRAWNPSGARNHWFKCDPGIPEEIAAAINDWCVY
jgi:hypothetical protein